MKKAELSVNIIVVAAIAVIILVILTVLVLRALGGFGDQTACENMDGFGSDSNARVQCVTNNPSCLDVYSNSRYVPIGNECSATGATCCLRVTSDRSSIG